MTHYIEPDSDDCAEGTAYAGHEKRRRKEWTLMFYFATDNPLAPGVISQLKAIKNAGYHPEVNVVTHFDPQSPGTPTHVFDVNNIDKLKDPYPNVGFGHANDTYVRNLLLDKLWRDETSRDGAPIREGIRDVLEYPGYDPPKPPPLKYAPGDEAHYREATSPKESLNALLDFCRINYPAKHYMLFILGHGLVVGNDVFLYDEHAARHSLTLVELGQALTRFKRHIGEHAQFELVSFHSCSLSAAEVAYELKDAVNYMLASQGPTFVASWPYKQILMHVMNKTGKGTTVKSILANIFYYCLYNNTDFLLAGYSFDLCLCNLKNAHLIREPLKKLSDVLVYGLTEPLVRDLILLAHWKSQSYWQENYTRLIFACFSQCPDRAGLDSKLVDHQTKKVDLNQNVQRVQVNLARGNNHVIVTAYKKEKDANKCESDTNVDSLQAVGSTLTLHAECEGENCGKVPQEPNSDLSSRNMRAILGIEQSGGSSAASAQNPFVDFFFNAPLSKSGLLAWGDIRLTTTPQQVAAFASSAANLVGAATADKINDLATSFDFKIGPEFQFNPGAATRVSLIAGFGAISALTGPPKSAPIFKLPANTSTQYANFVSQFPEATTPGASYIAFVPQEQDRFYRQYFAGLRIRSYHKDQFPSMFDVTFGQNSAVTEGKLRHFVLGFEGSHHIQLLNNAIYIFGSANLKVGGPKFRSTPFVLDPAEATIKLSDPTVVITSRQSNRDFYKIGFGIDLIGLFKQKKPE